MATMNTTHEQAQKYFRRVFSGGRGSGKAAWIRERVEDVRLEGGTALVCTPHGNAVATIDGYTCHRCKQSLPYTYGQDFNAMMAAHATACASPPLAKALTNPRRLPELGAQPAVKEIAAKRVIAFEADTDCPTDAFYTLVDGVVREHRFAGDPQVEMRHVERPIAVGDYVRWEMGERWVEGVVINPAEGIAEMTVERFHNWPAYLGATRARPSGCGRVRRIPRPGTAQYEVRAQEAHREMYKWWHVMGADYAKRDDRADALMYAMQAMPPKIDLDKVFAELHHQKLYDGLTAMQCYYRWSDNRACAERGAPLPYALTPAQIAAGRRAYQIDALNEWSGDLRALVAASDADRKSREPSVLVQIEDD